MLSQAGTLFRPKDLDFCFFDKCLGGVAQSTSGLLRRITPALLRSLATKKTIRCSSFVYALLKTQQTAPERKRNASEADKQQANKQQTIVIRTAGGSTCPAATRLLGKPGLLHTSHPLSNRRVLHDWRKHTRPSTFHNPMQDRSVVPWS